MDIVVHGKVVTHSGVARNSTHTTVVHTNSRCGSVHVLKWPQTAGFVAFCQTQTLCVCLVCVVVVVVVVLQCESVFLSMFGK